jgi:glycosyltransferase involved in cell wall biosynthesis
MKNKSSYKIVIISGNEQSEWISCRSILSGLHSLYSNLYKAEEILHLSLGHNSNFYDAIKLASEIKQNAPLKIVFLDYRPSPALFIKGLLSVYKKDKIPPLYIHVYGDFILNIPGWLDIVPSIQDLELKLICASDKQKKLLQKLFKAPQKTIEVLAFPVQTENFNFNESSRENFRKKYKVSEEVIFTYAGRLSLQKNVAEVIRCYKQVSRLLDNKTKLFLAGSIDDLSVPYLGVQDYAGTYQRLLLKEIDDDSSIKYLGSLSHQNLGELYNGSDIFVSLSTHNDEDYGMAPAQALCTGLPSILTDWGGYSSFKEKESKLCKLVPVEWLNEKPLQINFNICQKMMFSLASKKISMQARLKDSLIYQKSLSSSQNTKKLTSILSSKVCTIKEVTPLFYKTISTIQKNKIAPFRGRSGAYSDLYLELYQPYWEQTSE